MSIKSLLRLPVPSNILLTWNWGFILGMILACQILTGLFLSFHYSPQPFGESSFEMMSHLIRDINQMWMTQYIHMNGASLFFLCLFIHVGRGLYYNSFFYQPATWSLGMLMLITFMLVAFLGYVLPGGQMSFWGTTVISSMVSAIPKTGPIILSLLWGGDSISQSTLNRFFSLHYLMPLLSIILVMSHLYTLHEKGSNNPLGLPSKSDMIPFTPYSMIRDMLLFLLVFTMFMWMTSQMPFMVGEPENFNVASTQVTPLHIKPEWYFLFAYAILRSIPNKLGGVMALVSSLLIFMVMPLFNKKNDNFMTNHKMLFWLITNIFLFLTFLGAQPLAYPFITLGQGMTMMYFSMIIFYCI